MVEERATDEDALKARLSTYMKKLRTELKPYEIDGPTTRVIDMCCLVYAGGRLAIDYKVVPWRKKYLLKNVVRMFKRHRAFTSNENAKISAARKIAAYIGAAKDDAVILRAGSSTTKRKVQAASYIKKMGPNGNVEYCFLPTQFEAAVGGPRYVAEAEHELREANFLKGEGAGDSWRVTRKRTFGENYRPRVYCIPEAISG